MKYTLTSTSRWQVRTNDVMRISRCQIARAKSAQVTSKHVPTTQHGAASEFTEAAADRVPLPVAAAKALAFDLSTS